MDGSSPALLPPPGLVSFFLLSLSLSVFVAMAEVAVAFRETTYPPWKAVVSRFALPVYLFYAVATALAGLAYLEVSGHTPTWLASMVVGLAGPALLRTQVKLFQPISGAEEALSLSLERVLGGVQAFSFDQIRRRFAAERVARKEGLAKSPEKALLARVRALYPPNEVTAIEGLVEARRVEAPESVTAFLVSLIEQKDPAALDTPLPGEGDTGDHDSVRAGPGD